MQVHTINKCIAIDRPMACMYYATRSGGGTVGRKSRSKHSAKAGTAAPDRVSRMVGGFLRLSNLLSSGS